MKKLPYIAKVFVVIAASFVSVFLGLFVWNEYIREKTDEELLNDEEDKGFKGTIKNSPLSDSRKSQISSWALDIFNGLEGFTSDNDEKNIRIILGYMNTQDDYDYLKAKFGRQETLSLIDTQFFTMEYWINNDFENKVMIGNVAREFDKVGIKHGLIGESNIFTDMYN